MKNIAKFAILVLCLFAFARGADADITTGLVSHWAFDGNTNDPISSNNGTASGGPTYQGGQIGQAVLFDGSNDYVDMGNPASLNFGIGNFTISTWIRASVTQIDPIRHIIYKGAAAAGNTGYQFSILSTGNLRLQIGNGTVLENMSVNPAVDLRDDTWHHVVAVVDRNAERIYIDGVSKGVTGSISGINVNTGALFNVAGNGSAGSLAGYVDDVRIYNRALTGCDVYELYNGGPATGLINVQATFNGSPWSGDAGFTIDGPVNYLEYKVPGCFGGSPDGIYTLSFIKDGPANSILDPVNPYTPSSSQTISGGSPITFTINFITGSAQCSDGIDNDSDGDNNYSFDIGCTSASDNDERNDVSEPCTSNSQCVSDLYCNLTLGGYCLPQCQLVQTAGSYLFDFTNVESEGLVVAGTPWGGPTESGPWLGFNVPADTYKIKLASADHHPRLDDQYEEIWKARLGGSTITFNTPATSDLPNSSRYKEYVVHSNFVLTENISSITAVHAASHSWPPNIAESIYPVCALFEKYVPPVNPDYQILADPPAVYATIVGTKNAISSPTRIYIVPQNAYAENITLSTDISSYPGLAGAVANFTDSVLSNLEYTNGSILTFNIPATAIPDVYNIEVRGNTTDGLSQHTALSFSLNIIIKDSGFMEVLGPMIDKFAKIIGENVFGSHD